MKNNRRDFLKTAGLAGLSGFMLPVLAQQADEKRSLGMNNDQLKTPPKWDTVEDLVANRQALAGDPYRPLYHFSPPGFGLHDPGGLCYWKGKYHFFYLFSVPGVQWGRGHAVSDDMVHWRDLPMLPKSISGGTGQVWAEEDRVILGLAGDKAATASDPMLLKWTEQPVKSVVRVGKNTIPRVRSISMSQSFGRNPMEKPNGGAGQWLPYASFRTYKKEAEMSIPGPSNLFVFLDEHPNSINDAAFAVKCDARDGGARIIDFPASFHNGACGFAFGDGHAEIKKWMDKRTKVPASFDGRIGMQLNVASPNNPDVAWMQDRASARKGSRR